VPELHSYDYAIVRVAPCAERGEFANAGVLLYCSQRAFLGSRVHLDEPRLRALWPELDTGVIRRHLEAFPKICAGDPDAGPIARMSRTERFQWLVGPRSTVIQVSPVHSGMCESPEATLDELFRRLVLIEEVTMNRRDLMAGLALAGMGAGAEQHEPGSLYIPKPHLVEDRKLLHDFMDEFPFVDLVTCSPEIRITHIPVILERSAGKYGTIYGHVSRQNPQGGTFDGQHAAVIVFRGPHSYISPTWYTAAESVPTWNFAVVHASGKLKAITEKKPLHDLLAKLIQKFENYEGTAYDFSKLPEAYTDRMMAGIIGFEMEIEQLEGKFKLGQERSEADKEGILRNLRSAKQERSIYDLTLGFYKSTEKAGH
jgi:transcriptional regulator